MLDGVLLAGLSTPLAVLLAGYHPFAEDGGLYLAGPRYLLDPSLYPASRPFVTAHLQYSLFAPLLAMAVRHSDWPFETVVLLAHLLTVWATLFAAYLLAAVLFPSTFLFAPPHFGPNASALQPGLAAHPVAARAGALLLLAVWLGLPVAGTSLTVADPYLTARSFSTPCVMLALAAALHARQRRLVRAPQTTPVIACLGALVVGALFHPLMAGYGAACVGSFALVAWRGSALRRIAVLGIAALLGAALLRRAQPESAAARMAALTRSYWFLQQWRWYELVGLLAPLLLLACLSRRGPSRSVRELCRAATVAGCLSAGISLLFVRAGSASLLLARLQPLRLFQVVYLVMIVVLGGLLGTVLRSSLWRWSAAILVLAAPMAVWDQSAFRASSRLELSRHAVQANPWSSAFLWCRDHTAKNSVFALDDDYITQPGEDAQSFRVLAERSSLADQAKDGGEAAITPALADTWRRDMRATDSLSSLTDTARQQRLRPLGVTWVVLRSSAETAGGCPFNNEVVKVCPLL